MPVDGLIVGSCYRKRGSARGALVCGFALLLAATLVKDASASGGFGMTWAKSSHNATYGADLVGCVGCYPYTGDTACTNALPILCIKPDGAANPGLAVDFYHGWIGGNIGLTQSYKGIRLTSLEVANALCASAFGPGWVMAEF
ncbi:MAG TPA: hypothetical protein PK413_19710, partial [Thermoanaerobaculia bacterium]|nr:hypothetical protein [Thermoanaerobaculia bacterium]